MNEEILYNTGVEYKNDDIKDYTNEEFNIILRGYFDIYGNIINKSIFNKDLICTIDNIVDNKIYLRLKDSYTHKIENKDILLINYDAIDFLHSIYKNSDARYRDDKKYNIYLSWLSHIIFIPSCKFIKIDNIAVSPFKNKISDVGYNITIVKLYKKLGHNTFIYDTCIQLFPDFGYYISIIPKNSLIKSGHILTNSTGVVFPSSKGSLKITLTKVDKYFPNIKLPFTCCKIILNKHIYYEISEDFK